MMAAHPHLPPSPPSPAWTSPTGASATQGQPASTLRCSVIVPVYNGAGIITRCLDALARQRGFGPDDYEIVVVDDGSTDATAAEVEAWIERHPHLRCRLARQPNGGPGVARNTGVQLAQAELVLFTDADCAPVAGWMEALAAAFDDPAVMGAKGAYLTEQTGLVPNFVQAEYEERYARMAGRSQIDFIDTYSAAYRRALFLENNGFDPIFRGSCEDQEFSFRLAQKGYRLVFVPAAQVVHLHDASLGDYAHRKFFIGYWKALLTRLHPERMVEDSHTPQTLKLQILLSGLGLLLAGPALLGLWSRPLRWTRWPLLATVAAFLATALPFLRALARRQPRLALAGPLLLAVRALALGLGYLAGAIHWAGVSPTTRRPVMPGWKRAAKRGLDVVGASIGLALSLPLIAMAAVAIKLDSPGPVFYRQVRVGQNGRRFQMLKLRSMVQDADRQLAQLIDLEHLPEPAFKLANDPRVTRVGRFLRRTSLDELPQFINVLRGEMSLVGPRPEEERIVALYQDHHRRRLAVKPGMTGPMQVSGRGALPLAERLRLELEYIDHYSLRRDLAILWQTLPAIWRGRGAY
ncbi:MAG TPA: sugar transferase [Caldilineaceae bacterium]|nr:sugar transferase [Caldilineaceae bacterium]